MGRIPCTARQTCSFFVNRSVITTSTGASSSSSFFVLIQIRVHASDDFLDVMEEAPHPTCPSCTACAQNSKHLHAVVEFTSTSSSNYPVHRTILDSHQGHLSATETQFDRATERQFLSYFITTVAAQSPPSTSMAPTTVVYHAEVLLKIPFPNDLPRCLPPSPGRKRSRLLYDIHLDNGPPPIDLGLPSDLYIDDDNRVYAKNLQSWDEWRSQTINWPQDPDHHQPLVSDLHLCYSNRYGIGWAKSTTSSQHLTRRRMVQNTIYYRRAHEVEASADEEHENPSGKSPPKRCVFMPSFAILQAPFCPSPMLNQRTYSYVLPVSVQVPIQRQSGAKLPTSNLPPCARPLQSRRPHDRKLHFNPFRSSHRLHLSRRWPPRR